MIGLLTSLFLYEFVCRQFCDVDTDTCRSRRKDIMSWISGFFTLLMIRAKYLEILTTEAITSWKKRQEERIRKTEEALIPAS